MFWCLFYPSYQTVNYREENEIILIKDYRMRLKVENEEANETISADCDCEKKIKAEIMTKEDVDELFEEFEKEGYT